MDCPVCNSGLQGTHSPPVGSTETGGAVRRTQWDCAGCGARVIERVVWKVGEVFDDWLLDAETNERVERPMPAGGRAVEYRCPVCAGDLRSMEPVEHPPLDAEIHEGWALVRTVSFPCTGCDALYERRLSGSRGGLPDVQWRRFVGLDRSPTGSRVVRFEPAEPEPGAR